MKNCNPILILIFFVFTFLNGFSQEEAPFSITHGPYLQHLTDNGVIIVWTTNKNAVSWVELAPDDSTHFYLTERPKYYSAVYGFKDVGKLHAVRLENLLPATTYRYRVYSQEVLKHEGTKVQYGTVAATKVYKQDPLEFTTIDQAKKNLSFLIINDIHGNNEMMETLLKQGDYQKSDFIIFNGDMVSDFKSEEQLFGDFMDTAIKLFAREKPMYYARGNHETRGIFANAFPYYFPSPSGKLYYLLRQGPICFVVLDCGEDKPDSDIEYSGIVAFDQYRDAEKAWLEEAFKSKEFTDALYKVAVVHMPPFGGWHGEDEVAQKFVPLLDKAGVDVMFCGHLHQYIKKGPQPGIRFPIVVNANNTVVKAVAEENGMNIKVLNLQGGIVDSMIIQPEK
ncbi:MAG: purple acid phosphatase [Bacteroidetes bacterium GWF2_42_66]|nr:MAG: purple acid phosphatase [Bacteroidetes bacterium GWA2_42_15]OFX96842.1 MAG: purple acid phosphatase [Bacteroidetes bacterium GWE2_42_39]OFY46837.1 MAG: purple acid phosphatase [Bacteroidetes bacterium GWF2_42_66]HBL75122.1 purple acid phosphatase [Prolixibacteraceae bacterium]HCR89195.1 purple acid phosphatase [Prolixibacteraceae bacterium]